MAECESAPEPVVPGRAFGLAHVEVAGDPPAVVRQLIGAVADGGFSVVRGRTSAPSPLAGEGPEITRSVLDAPDLVVLAVDVDDTGLRTLVGLRAWYPCPLLVLSVPRFRIDPAALLDAGADMHARLPIGDDELRARIRALLRRSAAATVNDLAELRFEGLVLDRSAGALMVAGVKIRLDDLELQLAERLLRSGTRVVPRASLRAKLGLDDAQVDSLVRRLRNRLEVVEGWRRLVSERGVGFRLLEQPR